MRIDALLILLTFIAQAYADGLAANQAGDAQDRQHRFMDELVDKMVDKLVGRVLKASPLRTPGLKVSPLQRADVDATSLGHVRTKTVKGAAKKILEEYKNYLTNDFYQNQRVIAEVSDTPSKHMLNAIAGWTTHLYKIKVLKAKEVAEIEELKVLPPFEFDPLTEAMVKEMGVTEIEMPECYYLGTEPGPPPPKPEIKDCGPPLNLMKKVQNLRPAREDEVYAPFGPGVDPFVSDPVSIKDPMRDWIFMEKAMKEHNEAIDAKERAEAAEDAQNRPPEQPDTQEPDAGSD